MSHRERGDHADALILDALDLVYHVRTSDAAQLDAHIAQWDATRQRDLLITLAALVPDDRSVRQLTAWLPDWCDDETDLREDAKHASDQYLRECHRRYSADRRNDRTPEVADTAGHQEYDRRRAAAKRAEGAWAA